MFQTNKKTSFVVLGLSIFCRNNFEIIGLIGDSNNEENE